MRNAAQIHLARNNGGNATVAANVRAELGRAGLKQGALTEVLGLSEMGISRRLADNTEFSAGEIVLLAEFFDVSPGELFYTREDRSKRRTLVPKVAGSIPVGGTLINFPTVRGDNVDRGVLAPVTPIGGRVA